jgi:hypothetical protein
MHLIKDRVLKVHRHETVTESAQKPLLVWMPEQHTPMRVYTDSFESGKKSSQISSRATHGAARPYSADKTIDLADCLGQ